MSTALTAVIASQVVVALVSSQRVIEATMADIELSLKTRELREKILYRVNDEGGLMDACESDLSVKNANEGWGDGVEYKPKKGTKNSIKVDDKKKLVASNEKSDNWLKCGTMDLSVPNNIFSSVVTNGGVQVNLDMSLIIGTRTYTQKHRVQTQIVNE